MAPHLHRTTNDLDGDSTVKGNHAAEAAGSQPACPCPCACPCPSICGESMVRTKHCDRLISRCRVKSPSGWRCSNEPTPLP